MCVLRHWLKENVLKLVIKTLPNNISMKYVAVRTQSPYTKWIRGQNLGVFFFFF